MSTLLNLNQSFDPDITDLKLLNFDLKQDITILRYIMTCVYFFLGLSMISNGLKMFLHAQIDNLNLILSHELLLLLLYIQMALYIVLTTIQFRIT